MYLDPKGSHDSDPFRNQDNITETITISKLEYNRLLEHSNKLSALESYGVDNWQGYDDAMQYYYKEFVKEEAE